MQAKMVHENFHVLDMDRSIEFYRKAFGLEPTKTIEPEDGSWRIVFLGNKNSDFRLELTWNEGRTEPYENAGRDIHLAFSVDDFDEAYALHKAMGIIEHENASMGVYFVVDPDGFWLEVLRQED